MPRGTQRARPGSGSRRVGRDCQRRARGAAHSSAEPEARVHRKHRSGADGSEPRCSGGQPCLCRCWPVLLAKEQHDPQDRAPDTSTSVDRTAAVEPRDRPPSRSTSSTPTSPTRLFQDDRLRLPWPPTRASGGDALGLDGQGGRLARRGVRSHRAPDAPKHGSAGRTEARVLARQQDVLHLR